MIEQDPLEAAELALRTGLDLNEVQLHALSGLNGEALERFRRLWLELSAEQSATLLQQLGEAAEENLILDFQPIYGIALDDPDAGVRELGLRLAAEEVRPELLTAYLRTAVADPDVDVRLAAIEGLGNFALLAQTEEWPPAQQQQLETALVGLLHLPTSSRDIRRAALLALAYLTTDRTVTEIRQALLQPDLHQAAIEAMGRNCQEIWLEDIAAAMLEDDPELGVAAARAAGEMEDTRLVPNLLQQLGVDDSEVRFAAIEALGAIGGPHAKEALTELLAARNQRLREVARNAMATLTANEDPFSGLD